MGQQHKPLSPLILLMVLLAATIDAASKATTMLEVTLQHASLCVRNTVVVSCQCILISTLILYTAAVPGRPNSVRGIIQSSQSVQISWLPPLSNYQYITGYRVSYRNCPFCTLLYMDVNGATSRNLNINNLVPSTRYTFSVIAKSVVDSNPSSSITITVGKPSNLSVSIHSLHNP